MPSAAPAGATAPIAPAASAAQENCTIADAELWATRPIDSSSCEADGEGDAAHRAQNLAKNNLCAGGFLTSNPQTSALATQLTFRKLQAAADEIREEHDLGPQTVPDDRAPFGGDVHTTTEGDALGEGSLVRYVGFLVEGHFSGEEGVNCGRTRQENYDIHLAFSNTRSSLSITKAQGEALECRSITAEIIPRCARPAPAAAHHRTAVLRRIASGLPGWRARRRQSCPRVELGDSPGVRDRGVRVRHRVELQVGQRRRMDAAR